MGVPAKPAAKSREFVRIARQPSETITLACGIVMRLELSDMKPPDMIRHILAASLLAAVTSCASGPTYAEIKHKLPPIPSGQGRVFVYRTTTFGMAIKPDVKIDNKVAGTSAARGFLYSDQPPGSHEVSITTEWKHKNTVDVAAGRTSFVSSTVTPGLLTAHVIPNPVDAATGEAEIQNCKLATD